MNANVVLFLLPILILTPMLAAYAIQQLVVIPRLRKELMDLNGRRAQRVQAALAAASTSQWTEPAIAPNHPFAGWVVLNGDGSLAIGGRSFSHLEQFEITARDAHNIPRATAISHGSGDILISSHGQVFVVRFQENSWQVQQTNNSLPQ